MLTRKITILINLKWTGKFYFLEDRLNILIINPHGGMSDDV